MLLIAQLEYFQFVGSLPHGIMLIILQYYIDLIPINFH